MHAVGIHEPRHNLRVGSHVGRRDVPFGADHMQNLGRVAAGQGLKLMTAKNRGVTANSALGPPERKPQQAALPGHHHGQGAHLAQVDLRVKANTTLRRPHRESVLNTITIEGLYRAVR